jgi:hypothetical protein
MLIFQVSCQSFQKEKEEEYDAAVVYKDFFVDPFIPEHIIENTLCKSCTSNYDCRFGGGLCIYNLVTGETFCSLGCAETDCPEGFYCMPGIVHEKLTQCFPFDPSISCKENFKEYER